MKIARSSGVSLMSWPRRASVLPQHDSPASLAGERPVAGLDCVRPGIGVDELRAVGAERALPRADGGGVSVAVKVVLPPADAALLAVDEGESERGGVGAHSLARLIGHDGDA